MCESIRTYREFPLQAGDAGIKAKPRCKCGELESLHALNKRTGLRPCLKVGSACLNYNSRCLQPEGRSSKV